MPDDPITIRGALDLPPDDAARAFRARDAFGVSVSWRDFEPEEHARAFTVAKVARLDILADIRESLGQALAEGKTFAQWRGEIVPTLQSKGWWGMVTDPSLTGTADPVFVGERRLRTIFATNMRVSRAAGQWARIQQLADVRPWLRYSAVLDSRTRPLHARWHAIIRRVDDPIWQTLFPPNGWNCRCGVTQWSDRDLERRGWRETPDNQLPELLPTGNAWFGQPRQRRDVIRGIDPGWNYNVGEQSLLGLAEKAAETLARAEAAGLRTTAAGDRAAILDMLAEVLGRRLAELLLIGLVGTEAGAKKAKRAEGGGGADEATRAKLSAIAIDRNRDAGGRFEDEPRTLRGPADRGEIRRHARRALERNSYQERLPLGPATGLESLAGQSRYPIASYRRVMDADAVRHTWSRHGPGGTKITADAPELALSRRDFERLPDILKNPINRLYSSRKHTTDRIEYWAELDGHRFILVEEVRPRVGEVALKTLYKVAEFPKMGTRRA